MTDYVKISSHANFDTITHCDSNGNIHTFELYEEPFTALGENDESGKWINSQYANYPSGEGKK